MQKTLDLRKQKVPSGLVHALVIVGEFLIIAGFFGMVFLWMVAFA